MFVQAEEEARSLQKKIQQIENDLDQTMEQLMQVNAKLDEKDKALQNVSCSRSVHWILSFSVICYASENGVIDRQSLVGCYITSAGKELLTTRRIVAS
jgi:tropomyosin-1